MGIKRTTCFLFACLSGTGPEAQEINCTDPRVKPIDRITNFIRNGSSTLGSELKCLRVAEEINLRTSMDEVYVKGQVSDEQYRHPVTKFASSGNVESFKLDHIERLEYKEIGGSDSDERPLEILDTVPGYISR